MLDSKRSFLQNVRKIGPHQRPQMRFTTSSAMIRISNTGMVHLPSMKMLFLRCRVIGNLPFFDNVCRQRCGDQAKRNPSQHFSCSFVLRFPSLKAILSFRTGFRKIRSLSSSRDQRTSHGFFHHVCQQSHSDRTAENSQHHGSISCSLVSVSLSPFSTAHRSLVQSCTISRVTSVPISTIVEIIFSSFQGLRSVSRFRETRQSLPVALHHFRHQRHSGQAQRNPSQHFSFPFVWFWGFHSLRVMFFSAFRTGFRKNPIFLIPAFRRWRALRGASAHNPRGQTPQNRYNPTHLVRSFRFLSSNKSIQFPLFPDRIPKNPIF